LHCGFAEFVTQMPPEHDPEQHSKSYEQASPAVVQHAVSSVPVPSPPEQTLVCAPTGPASESAPVWHPVIAIGNAAETGTAAGKETESACTASPATKPSGNNSAFALIMMGRKVVRIQRFQSRFAYDYVVSACDRKPNASCESCR
jgi:hypothetical protein